MTGEDVHRLRELALRAKQGDWDALEQVLRHPDVRKIVYDAAQKMHIHAENADILYGLVQEKIWKGIGSWQGRSKLTTWVFSITQCACLDLHRSRQQEVNLVSCEHVEQPVEADQHDIIVIEDVLRRLREEIQGAEGVRDGLGA